METIGSLGTLKKEIVSSPEPQNSANVDSFGHESSEPGSPLDLDEFERVSSLETTTSGSVTSPEKENIGTISHLEPLISASSTNLVASLKKITQSSLCEYRDCLSCSSHDL